MAETTDSERATTHLYLIRHGQAVVNVEAILGGMKGDTGLTPLGVAQAERLRDRLTLSGEIQADVLIASTFPRARQTAEIIAPALGLPIVLDDEAQEMRPGIGDGMRLEEYKAKYGWVDFDKEPLRMMAPGGESWGQFTLRVGQMLARITQEHAGKTIVLVCHGGIIDVSFLYFFRMPTLSLPPIGFVTHNTSITHWEHTMQRGRMLWRLARYNDDTHLLDVGRGTWIDWSAIPPEKAPPEAMEESPAAPLPTEPGEGDDSAAAARG